MKTVAGVLRSGIREEEISVETFNDIAISQEVLHEHELNLSDFNVSEEGLVERLKLIKESLGSNIRFMTGNLTQHIKHAKKLEDRLSLIQGETKGEIKAKSELGFILPKDDTVDNVIDQFAYLTSLAEDINTVTSSFLKAGAVASDKALVSNLALIFGGYGIAINKAVVLSKGDELKDFHKLIKNITSALDLKPLKKNITKEMEVTKHGVVGVAPLLASDRALCMKEYGTLDSLELVRYFVGVANNLKDSAPTTMPALTKAECLTVVKAVKENQKDLEVMINSLREVSKNLIPALHVYENNSILEVALSGMVDRVNVKGESGSLIRFILKGCQEPALRYVNLYNRISGLMLSIVEKSIKTAL